MDGWGCEGGIKERIGSCLYVVRKIKPFRTPKPKLVMCEVKVFFFSPVYFYKQIKLPFLTISSSFWFRLDWKWCPSVWVVKGCCHWCLAEWFHSIFDVIITHFSFNYVTFIQFISLCLKENTPNTILWT